MGIALQDQGKLEEAIEAYKKAISIKPDYTKAYNNMGIALQNEERRAKILMLLNCTKRQSHSSLITQRLITIWVLLLTTEDY